MNPLFLKVISQNWQKVLIMSWFVTYEHLLTKDHIKPCRFCNRNTNVGISLYTLLFLWYRPLSEKLENIYSGLDNVKNVYNIVITTYFLLTLEIFYCCLNRFRYKNNYWTTVLVHNSEWGGWIYNFLFGVHRWIEIFSPKHCRRMEPNFYIFIKSWDVITRVCCLVYQTPKRSRHLLPIEDKITSILNDTTSVQHNQV